MGVWLISAALLLYAVWAVRRIIKRRKQSRSHCADCPYHQNGICGKAGGEDGCHEKPKKQR